MTVSALLVVCLSLTALSLAVTHRFGARGIEHGHQAALARLQAQHARELATVHREHLDSLRALHAGFLVLNEQSEDALESFRSNNVK